jgi:hypothetical protein
VPKLQGVIWDAFLADVFLTLICLLLKTDGFYAASAFFDSLNPQNVVTKQHPVH